MRGQVTTLGVISEPCNSQIAKDSQGTGRSRSWSKFSGQSVCLGRGDLTMKIFMGTQLSIGGLPFQMWIKPTKAWKIRHVNVTSKKRN